MRRRHFILSASGILATLAAPRRAWAADPVSGRFAVTGGTLGYRRYGTAGRPYVLLSGGPGLNSSYVDPIAIELSHERTIVVLDQRGTGTSRDAIGDGSQLTVAGAIADLDALRAALGLTHLSLLGHSWGAMLSMAYAAAHGDRVASLVLLDPGGPDPSFFISFRQMTKPRRPQRRTIRRPSSGCFCRPISTTVPRASPLRQRCRHNRPIPTSCGRCSTTSPRTTT